MWNVTEAAENRIRSHKRIIFLFSATWISSTHNYVRISSYMLADHIAKIVCLFTLSCECHTRERAWSTYNSLSFLLCARFFFLRMLRVCVYVIGLARATKILRNFQMKICGSRKISKLISLNAFCVSHRIPFSFEMVIWAHVICIQ